MASKNNLLGSGKPYEEDKVEVVIPAGKLAPMLLYRADCIKGIYIDDDIKIIQMLKEGWKNHPGKVALLPGWEHLYEDKKEVEEEKQESLFGDLLNESDK